MELKKITVAAMTVSGISFAVAAGPATVPASAPAVVSSAAPSTQPAAKPQTYSSENFSDSRRDRGGRRGRGNRESSETPMVSGSDPYAVLDTRNIFIKGDQTTAVNAPRALAGGSGAGRIFSDRQPSALVFNGVILVNGEALAMVEDTGTGVVVQVHAGDQISGGRVTGITFGDLAYEGNGQTKHVAIGQTLEGRAPSGSSYSNAPVGDQAGRSSSGAAPVGAPGGGSATSPPGSSTSGLSSEDILAKLKARRAAEEAGGK